jgi:hypothetical protein
MAGKFYALRTSPTLQQAAKFGPFYPRSVPPTAAQDNSIAGIGFGTRGQTNLVSAGAYAKFPGVFTPPSPARAYFNTAAFAGITNHATFTLDDGVNPAAVFEYIKSGSPTPGNIEITITGLVTAAEIAAETADEINDYTLALGDTRGGFLATVKANDATQVLLVQTGLSPANQAFARIFKWTGLTYGATANIPIIVGAGSGLTNVVGLTGGKEGQAGITAQFVRPGHNWALSEGAYEPVPKG